MRIFQDALEMIKEVERDLAEMGIEYQSYSVQDQVVANNVGFQTRELVGYSYRLNPVDHDFQKINEMLEYKKDEDFILWARQEATERIHDHHHKNRNPGNAWEYRKKFWQQFIRNGKFAYTYVERWQEQLSYLIDELVRHPTTRQAVMTMYDRHQDLMNWGGIDRVPCSLTYQVMIRGDKVYMIYSQRSCDFVNFFQADVYCTIMLQRYLATILNLDLGPFIHHLNSLHAFKKDMEGVF